jgi:hypothetical protein
VGPGAPPGSPRVPLPGYEISALTLDAVLTLGWWNVTVSRRPINYRIVFEGIARAANSGRMFAERLAARCANMCLLDVHTKTYRNALRTHFLAGR